MCDDYMYMRTDTINDAMLQRDKSRCVTMSHNNDKSTFFHRPITTSRRELPVSNHLVENMNASQMPHVETAPTKYVRLKINILKISCVIMLF